MQKLYLLLFLLGSYHLSFGTTIAIAINSDSVVMTADSKLHLISNATSRDSSVVATKIYQSGNYYFGIANFIAAPVNKFFAAKIIDKHLKKEVLQEAIQNSEVEIKAAIQNVLLYDKKHHIKSLTALLIPNGSICQVGIIGIENAKPFACIISFTITDVAKLEVGAKDFFLKYDNKSTGIAILGQYEASKSEIQNLLDQSLSLIEVTKRIVEIEIQAKPDDVGYPIDVVALTRTDEKWFGKKEGPVRF